MKSPKMFSLFLALAICTVSGSAFAQSGTSGQTGAQGTYGNSGSSRTTDMSPSGAAAKSGEAAKSGSAMFTIVSSDERANTIKVRTSHDLSQFKQGQQITFNLKSVSDPSMPGRSEQTPSRGNAPYGQTKKDISGSIVSIDQSAKTITLRLAGSDFPKLRAGTDLVLSADHGSSAAPTGGSQGLRTPADSSPSGTSASPSGSAPRTSPPNTSPSSPQSGPSDRQSDRQ